MRSETNVLEAEDHLDQAAAMYRAGLTTAQIGRHFKVVGETARRWLHLKGVQIRSRAERSRRYYYDNQAFERRTAEAAYYAGLLMADGSIDPKKRLLSLEIHKRDEELVLNFKAFLKYTGMLSYRTRRQKSGTLTPTVALRLTAPELIQQLRAWGVVPRKSKVGVVGRAIAGVEEFFFRGLFDGDGCAHRRRCNTAYANFCGTPAVVRAFRKWCRANVGHDGYLDIRSETVHVVQFYAGNAVSLGRLLYSNPVGPRMSRKERLLQ